MKNPLAHLTLGAPFHLLKSLIFHLSSHVRRKSISGHYLGLCAYVHAFSVLHLEKGANVTFSDQGFLVLGTERSSFRGWARRNSLFIKRNGSLQVHGYNEIGRGSLVWILEGGQLVLKGNSFTAGNNIIIAKSHVEIGRNCSIAWGVTITDHDFHSIYKSGIRQSETVPVCIEDGVWIGMNATILKGVTVGARAVIGAGAVVTRNVPPGSLVAGVPARVVKDKVEFFG